MSIKAIYEKKEDIPQDYESLFKEKDGKWEIEVEGMKTQGDIERLQEAARKEREDHDATKAELKEIRKTHESTTAELEVLKEKANNGRKGGEDLSDDERIRLKLLEKELQETKAALAEKENDYIGLQTEVKSGTIKSELMKAATKHIKSEAIPDVLDLIADKFDILDGKVLTKEQENANSLLDAETFLASYVKERPHFSIPSNSGGATGGANSKTDDGGGVLSAEDHLRSKAPGW